MLKKLRLPFCKKCDIVVSVRISYVKNFGRVECKVVYDKREG